MKILILEDSTDDVELEMLFLIREGFDIEWTHVGNEKNFKKELLTKPDVALIDCSIPKFDCITVLRKYSNGIPIIVVSGTIGEEAAAACIKAGATDYVLKGNISRLGTVVKRAIKEFKLAREAEQSKEDLKLMLEGVIASLTATVEYRDRYTAGHQQKTADLAKLIAEKMGLDSKAVYIAGMLHDIGKIAVPIEILSKPDLITDVEFELIKKHPQVGYNILKSIKFPWDIANIVLQHHERVDGSGYPKGLTDIMIEARIIGVADTFEAMSSHRPYRPAIGVDKALDELSNDKYDKEVVKALKEVVASVM